MDELADSGWDIDKVVRDCLVASNERKKRVEVRERYLSDAEKGEFRAAKNKEWGSFVNNEVVELATMSGVPAERIIGSRWVLT